MRKHSLLVTVIAIILALSTSLAFLVTSQAESFSVSAVNAKTTFDKKLINNNDGTYTVRDTFFTPTTTGERGLNITIIVDDSTSVNNTVMADTLERVLSGLSYKENVSVSVISFCGSNMFTAPTVYDNISNNSNLNPIVGDYRIPSSIESGRLSTSKISQIVNNFKSGVQLLGSPLSEALKVFSKQASEGSKNLDYIGIIISDGYPVSYGASFTEDNDEKDRSIAAANEIKALDKNSENNYKLYTLFYNSASETCSPDGMEQVINKPNTQVSVADKKALVFGNVISSNFSGTKSKIFTNGTYNVRENWGTYNSKEVTSIATSYYRKINQNNAGEISALVNTITERSLENLKVESKYIYDFVPYQFEVLNNEYRVYTASLKSISNGTYTFNKNDNISETSTFRGNSEGRYISRQSTSGLWDLNSYIANATTKEGKALVIEYTIRAEDAFLGGDNVPASSSAAGLYKTTPASPYTPSVSATTVPKINVPVRDVSVAPLSKPLYFKNAYKADDLRQDVLLSYEGRWTGSKYYFNPDKSIKVYSDAACSNEHVNTGSTNNYNKFSHVKVTNLEYDFDSAAEGTVWTNRASKNAGYIWIDGITSAPLTDENPDGYKPFEVSFKVQNTAGTKTFSTVQAPYYTDVYYPSLAVHDAMWNQGEFPSASEISAGQFFYSSEVWFVNEAGYRDVTNPKFKESDRPSLSWVVRSIQPSGDNLTAAVRFRYNLVIDSSTTNSGVRYDVRSRTCAVCNGETELPSGYTALLHRVSEYFTIQYEANAPEDTTVTGQMGKQICSLNQDVTLSSNQFMILGYEFKGWNTKADGTGTAYANEAVVRNLAANGESITLYAQWTETKCKVYRDYVLVDGAKASPDLQRELNKSPELVSEVNFGQNGTSVVYNDNGNKITGYTNTPYGFSYVADRNEIHHVVTFTPKEHKLIVNYQFDDSVISDGTELPENFEKTYKYYDDIDYILIDELETESGMDENGNPLLYNVTVDGSFGSVFDRDEDITVTVTFSAPDLPVKINYVYADGSPAPVEQVDTTVKYNHPYEKASPELEGYSVSLAAVDYDGVRAPIDETVVYYTNSHTLTINYVDETGAPVADAHTETVFYQANYSVASPSVNGYKLNNPDEATISGTMPDNDVTINVVYVEKPATPEHKVTVNYMVSSGNATPPEAKKEMTVQEGDNYNIETPAMIGYTPDKSIVSGVMGTEDITETVTYSPNPHTVTWIIDGEEYRKDNVVFGDSVTAPEPVREGYTLSEWTPEVATTVADQDYVYNAMWQAVPCSLTIHYVYANGSTAAPDYTSTVNYNESYSVTSPAIENYTPDMSVVSGQMTNTAGVEVTVTYAPNAAGLTIYYKYENGSEAKPSYTDTTLVFGDNYSVNSPSIEGYTPDKTVVSGTVNASSIVETVVYHPNKHNLIVTVKYSDNAFEPAVSSEEYVYGSEYSVTIPEVSGYVGSSEDALSGIMPDNDVNITITYRPNSRNVTVTTVYSDNSKETTSETTEYAFGAEYGVTIPDVVGYTGVASGDSLTGIIEYSDINITITYSPNNYALNVTYVMSDGNNADKPSDVENQMVAYNAQYNVVSPAVNGYTPDIEAVTGIMDDVNGKNATVTYTPVDCDLTVKYIIEGSSEPFDTHNETVKYNAQYSVESPSKTGYELVNSEQATISGKMDNTEGKTVEVYYKPSDIPITITYTMSDGSTPPAKYENTVPYGSDYDVDSPDVPGYTPDKAEIKGTMDENGVDETVTYTPNSYELEVTYVMSDGTDAPEKHVESVVFNTDYSVDSPDVEGYTPDTATVTGTMDDVNGKKVTVTYNPNEYELTVTYVMSDGSTPPEKHTENVVYNTNYDVASPSVTGYTPDTDRVTGVMDDINGKTATVTYVPNNYELKITYETDDGTEAPEAYTGSVAFNSEYNVPSPEVPHYTPDVSVVSGIMDSEGKEFTVVYTANPYTVKFDVNTGDGTMDDLIVKYNQTYDLPENQFSKDGAQFTGWNTSADGTGMHYNDRQTVKNITEDNEITLYAQWLTFDKTSSDSNRPGETIEYNIVLTIPEDANTVVITDNIPEGTIYNNDADNNGVYDNGTIRWEFGDGYAAGSTFTVKFSVTIDNVETGKSITNIAEADIDGDVYESSAAENAVTYVKVWYDLNGGEGDVPVDPAYYAAGETVTVLKNENAVKPDAKFTGWNTEQNGTGTHYNPEETFEISNDVILYAQWIDARKSAARTGDTLIPGDVLEYSINITATENADEMVVTDSIPEKTMYVDGSADNNGTYENGKITWIVENAQANTTYVFTFRVQLSDDVKSEDVLYNTAYVLANGNTYTVGGSSVTDDPLETPTDSYYNVSYDINGGEGETPSDSTNYIADAIVVVKDNTGFSNGNYIFAGWNTDKDGAGTHYDADEAFNINSDINLYAQWVLFTKASEIGTDALKPGSEIKYSIDITVPEAADEIIITDKLPDSVDLIKNEAFTGSYDEESRTITWTVTGVEIAPKSTVSISFNAVVKEDVPTGTLIENKADALVDGVTYTSTATSDAVGYYKVKYTSDSNGDVPVDNAPYLENEVVTVKEKGNLTKDGFVFAGWINDDGIVMSEKDTFAIVKNTTFNALWAKAEKTVNNEKTNYGPGDEISYNIKVTVPEGIKTVTVTDNIPDSLSVVSATNNDEIALSRQESNTLVWTIANAVAKEYNINIVTKVEKYTAGGKIKNTAKADFGNNYTADMSKEAQMGYSLTYHSEGKSLEDSVKYTKDAKATVKNVKEVAVKEGWNFLGWNTKADGTGTFYKEGAEFVVSDNSDLYAQWAKLEKTVNYKGTAPGNEVSYAIKFITTVNGAAVTINDIVPASLSVTSCSCADTSVNVRNSGNTVTAVITNAVANREYLITVRATISNSAAKGLLVENTASATINSDTFSSETARFTVDCYKIVYFANGASGTVPTDSKYYSIGDTATVLPGSGLNKDGYTFTGWNTDPNGKGKQYKAGDTITVDGDVVLYATFEAKPATVIRDVVDSIIPKTGTPVTAISIALSIVFAAGAAIILLKKSKKSK